MAPKGSRTPADLWWVAVVAIAVVGIALDWTVSRIFVVSLVTAVALGVGHLVVTQHRRRREAQPS